MKPARKSSPLIAILLVSLQLFAHGADLDNWPESWQQSYKRFQSFIDTRDRIWPNSNLSITSKGKVTYSLREFQAKKHHSYNIYNEGFSRLSRNSKGHFEITKIFEEGNYLIDIKAHTKIGYQHFPPLLQLTINRNESGEKQCLITATPDNDSLWPNWRALSFIDYHTLKGHHSSLIYEENKRVTPSISLKVDHQAQLRRPLLHDENAEKALRWRIYHKGKLAESGVAKKELIKPCNYGTGYHLAFLCIEGPQGMMPVSNIVTYYVQPERSRAQNSLIRNKNKDLKVLYAQGFVPGYLYKQPWILEEE